MPASGAASPGLLYVYYNKYIHPTSLSTTSSAEALLGVIAGGSGTLTGPAVGAALVLLLKNYASAYVERWNMLLGPRLPDHRSGDADRNRSRPEETDEPAQGIAMNPAEPAFALEISNLKKVIRRTGCHAGRLADDPAR